MPRKTLAFVGTLLVLVAISGLPHQWKTAYSIVAGILLVFVAMRAGYQEEASVSKGEDNGFKNVMTDDSLSHAGKETED